MIITDKIIRKTRLSKTGARGLCVNLPKRHLTKLGYQAGDDVEIYALGDSLMIKIMKRENK